MLRPAPVLFFALALSVLLLAFVSATPAQPTPVPPQNTPALEQGRKLFETHCVLCHGPHGEGGKGPTLAQPILPRASDDASLIRIITDGIGGTEMPGAHLQQDEVKLVAAFVRSLGSLPQEKVPGDPAQGERLFTTKGDCVRCHSFHGHGGAIGPDLADIGRRRSAAYLRRALVDPNADVPQSFSAFRSDVPLPLNFLYVRAVERDGTEIDGVRVNEDTFSIQIRDLTGRVHSFFKADLLELHKDWGKSPMPSYAATMTPDELNDVVAFLVSLRKTK
jgi:cytochrome c oxidase cbb3-type subunit 3